MKVATGTYYNLFSAEDSDNYGLKVKFDILIVFPESFDISNPDIIDSLELLLEGRLRGLGMEMPFAKKKDVEEAVKQTLEALDYDYERIVVDQALTCKSLKTAV